MPRVHAGVALDGLLDLVFPRRCVVCRAPGSWLCDACAAGLHPLPDDRCRRCGAPLRRAGRPAHAGSGARRMPACRECAGRDLAFSSATAAFCYEGPARALVTACKFRALRTLTDDLAEALRRRSRRSPPVPAPRPSSPPYRLTAITGSSAGSTSRSRSPGGLRGTHGLAYAPLLRRVRHGARQSGLDRASRAANVHHAFALRDGGFG